MRGLSPTSLRQPKRLIPARKIRRAQRIFLLCTHVKDCDDKTWFDQFLNYSAAAPETISMISRVMAACRTRFIFKVNEEIRSPAFLEAASIAVMRAPCSEAIDSSKARKICVSTKRGNKRVKI